ncbi:uncharacterized protein PADG_02925 [Paracoccidioides brasiliensis Pb18]|uniref:Uncharacterized protein n=1 Tax=Paracoccidioides brasiliensis (strain Pb18) TaxID=502780 RepID=C1G6X0_PARBD|nr:uncharacterized protein PADG_02925 [Paracoccidioides brasiliensis Pb18]EEH46827.2 hypothetical protein PADG_02925 [Paracoccidioides brasiliensis Pb18]ODH48321.1 hypothetical protein GX48_05522 [Paracoccidioides brasiliensis]
MAVSSHPDDFFRTTAAVEDSHRKAKKSENLNGNPIKLNSKLLAIAADPSSSHSVYVAESAGLLRRVELESGKTSALYKGPTAPLTSICLSPDGTTIYAGCWDKTIWSWDVATRQPKQRYEGHTDFVKALISLRVPGDDLLISGGADTQIIIWSIRTGKRLHSFTYYALGIQDFAIDPLVSEEDPSEVTVFSAGSDPAICYFKASSPMKELKLSEPIVEHKTGVFKIFFDADGDLWTASADKTAKCLTRETKWKPNMVLEHPDFVKDVVVHERGGWVVTACRDEEVRVWNCATGKLHHTYSGHFEEVTGLLLINSTIVSISIDATIRQWSLDPAQLQEAKAKAESSTEDNEVENPPESLLTEEEERELAELMGDD